MHRNSRIRDAVTVRKIYICTWNNFWITVPLSLPLWRSSFPSFALLFLFPLCRSTYVNFHKYFLHNASYPWNDLGAKARGPERGMQRETISATKLQPHPPLLQPLPQLSPCVPGSCVSLISCPRNRCFQPSFSFPSSSSKLGLSCNYATSDLARSISMRINVYRNVCVCVYLRYILTYYFIREIAVNWNEKI